jgi:transcriptional regulator with XRE-family HTH domain
MTDETKPGASRELSPVITLHPHKTRALAEAEEVKRLKTALFAALDSTGLNLKEIAEKCGLESANRLYNVKNGHSNVLSVLTYITLARHLNMPISELLGMPDRPTSAPASARDDAALQKAVERFAASFAFARTAIEQFKERHIEADTPGIDQAARGRLFFSFQRVDRGLEAVAQDITELLNQLRDQVPELPSLPPL